VYRLVSEDPLQSLFASIGYYWDKETGILTERNGIYVNHTGLYATSWRRSDRIKDTNLWKMKGEDSSNGNGVEGFPYGLFGVIAVAATLTVVVMFRRRKRKLKSRKSRK
jgi:hypothetical protein